MNRMLLITLLLITTALMGSSFTIGKIGLPYISPLLLVGLRFFLAGTIMVFFVVLTKKPHPTTLKVWLRIVLIGLFQTTGFFATVFISLHTIPAGESSIIAFTNPMLVIIFGSFVFGMKHRFIQWIGVFIGFAGVFITLGGQLQFQVGTILSFAGAISWAIATLLVNRWGKNINTWVLSAYQMLFGSVILLLLSAFFEDAYFIFNRTSVFIFLWLTIMASIVQFMIWYSLLQREDPAKISSFLFLVPFFGIISGWILLNEPIGPAIILGGLLIFSGIFLVNWPEKLKDKLSHSA